MPGAQQKLQRRDALWWSFHREAVSFGGHMPLCAADIRLTSNTCNGGATHAIRGECMFDGGALQVVGRR